MLAHLHNKLRHEDSSFWPFYYILEPLALFVIIMILRPSLGGGNGLYPLYVFSGLVIFNFFSKGTQNAIQAWKVHRNIFASLSTKPVLIVFSSVTQYLGSHLVELLFVLLFLIYYGQSVFAILWYIIMFPLFFLFTVGCGFLLSFPAVAFSGFPDVWRIFTRLLWFATPIFYVVREELLTFFLFNPLYHFLALLRGPFVGDPVFSLIYVVLLCTFSVGVYGVGWWSLAKHRSWLLERV